MTAKGTCLHGRSSTRPRVSTLIRALTERPFSHQGCCAPTVMPQNSSGQHLEYSNSASGSGSVLVYFLSGKKECSQLQRKISMHLFILVQDGIKLSLNDSNSKGFNTNKTSEKSLSFTWMNDWKLHL